MIKVLTVLLIVGVGLACNMVENKLPLVDEEPRLLLEVPNGQKYLIGDPVKNGDYLFVANLKGTPYEMGVAFGQMFAVEGEETLKLFYNYYLTQLEDILAKKVPAFMAKSLTKGVHKLANRILDLNIRITKRYTNRRYYEQIRGIAHGSGGKITFRDVARLNVFPELIKAACTVAGVWKEASFQKHTLHVRALDWDSKNPISKYPVMVVYHPSDPKLHVHANLGWAGFVGSMTGISDSVSLGEKVWLPPKHSVKMTRYGNPWTYVFRDVLYDAHDMSSALKILTETHRTCAIHIGLGSIKDKSFRMLQYSENILNNYDDTNYTHYAANHPKKSGVAYFDKHVQPSKDSCVGQILTDPQFYGKWQAEKLWRWLGLTHGTGDTQLVVFDLHDMVAYVSYSSSEGTAKGYERRPIFVDIKQFFAPF